MIGIEYIPIHSAILQMIDEIDERERKEKVLDLTNIKPLFNIVRVYMKLTFNEDVFERGNTRRIDIVIDSINTDLIILYSG